ncbi:hypothetical protein RA2_04087 [Roseovarius sp. A-2]|uniref:hypothetical protein n=1 Tax=Roseovarius sp. A-2 TaxID=1570360 RepID=UPI0009B543AC|nr:hypothetical protein [Roseovarius sp. A-2]GAW37012.1 hypothetical protein RA2_04087 [Roseovarius sp. A-2]
MIGILKIIAAPVASLFGRAANRFGILNILLIAAAVAFAWLSIDRIRDQAADMQALESRAVNAEQSAVDAQAALKLERETHAAEMEALRVERDAEKARAADAREIIDAIRSAPDSDDAPVAPVLSDALDALRERQ